jgi:CBS-domain-containing membrane protein
MNVAFFLTPKQDVVWVPLRASMRQALERMEHHQYSSIPLLDDDGGYAGTLTEGDLLWKLKRDRLTLSDTERVLLSAVPRRVTNRAVRIDADIEELFEIASEQNFVPVVDDRGAFVGIVRRKTIIEHLIRLARAV